MLYHEVDGEGRLVIDGEVLTDRKLDVVDKLLARLEQKLRVDPTIIMLNKKLHCDGVIDFGIEYNIRIMTDE